MLIKEREGFIMNKKLELMRAYEVALITTSHAFDVYVDSSMSVYYNNKNKHYYVRICDEFIEIGSSSALNDFFLEIGEYYE